MPRTGDNLERRLTGSNNTDSSNPHARLSGAEQDNLYQKALEWQRKAGKYTSYAEALKAGLPKAKPDIQVTPPGTETQGESSSSMKEMPQEGDKTQRRESDTQTHPKYIIGSGWQGPPRQGLESFLKTITTPEVLSSLKEKNRKERYRYLHRLYRENTEEQPTFDEELHFDEHFVETTQCPDGWERKPTDDSPYIVFYNKVEDERAKADEYRHYESLRPNIHPYRFKEKFPELLETLAKFSYVGAAKVAKNINQAHRMFDNFVIAFHNPPGSTNRSDLELLLRSYVNDTRDGHPAMLKPIDDQIQGIGWADYSGGKSFGGTRCLPIEKAIWALEMRKEEITFETLLQETEKQFRNADIDPNDPSKRLNEEE